MKRKFGNPLANIRQMPVFKLRIVPVKKGKKAYDRASFKKAADLSR